MLARCAVVRSLQLAEAAARVLEISVEYAGQRKADSGKADRWVSGDSASAGGGRE